VARERRLAVTTATPAVRLDGAAALRAHRVEAGLTQQQLANRAGLSVRTVQGLESGEFVRPRPSTLRQLHAALTTARAQREPRRTGAVRSYAEPVPTDAAGTDRNRDQTARSVTSFGLPDRYARPARQLATVPPRDAYPLFWLELIAPATVATSDGPVSVPRVNVCRALPTDGSARRGWRTTVLAAGVNPLDGVEIVDALRVFRGPIVTDATGENR
jgi:transcriptional regulator with XRE-family HTH domain